MLRRGRSLRCAAMHRLLAFEPVAAAGKPLAGSLLPAILLALGALVIIAVLVRLLRRRAATSARERAVTPRARIEAIRAGEGRENDAHAAEARLLETAQRLAGQLDAKADRLEQLIAAADERIEAIGALASGAPVPGPAAARSRRDEPAHPPDPLTAAVYEMADLGRDPVEIARALDEQIGKVELILALRQ
jgi:hypothetical protein